MNTPKQIISISIASGLANAAMAQITTIAAWDTFEDPAVGASTPSLSAPDITATLTATPGTAGTVWWRWDRGSNDGNFGGSISGADNTGTQNIQGALAPAGNVANQDQNFLAFSITNNSAVSYDLQEFVFDAWRPFNGAPYSVTLMSGVAEIGTLNSIFAKGAEPVSGNANNYDDFTISLAGYGLNPNETLDLQLYVNDADITKVASTYFDNIAITAVPEPATVAFFVGVSGFVLILFRRRRFTSRMA